MVPDYIQSGAVAIDPYNGHIKVMVGGRSFIEKKFNNVIQARRQPGSAFKTFIYIAALANGYSPSDVLLDTPIVIEMPNGEVYKPRNFSQKFHGAVSLRYALDKSINIPAVKLLQKLGGPSVIGTAHEPGDQHRLMPYLSLALGAQEVTLLELTSAFGVMAAEGITGQTDGDHQDSGQNGNILEEFRETRRGTLPPDRLHGHRYAANRYRRGNGQNGPPLGLRIPCAGKTGTTTNSRTDGSSVIQPTLP